MKSRTTVVSCAKTLALSIICLCVLEVCARLDDWVKWDAPFLGNYSRESLVIVDSLGLRNRPNSQYEKWKINGFGFRGDEIQRKKPPGVNRIMVIGASEAFGLYEAAGKEFPAQLQSRLNIMFPGQFEVINAAIPGLSPPRILNLYKHWLANFEPDMVIYYPSFSGYLMRKAPEDDRFDVERAAKPKGLELRIIAKATTALKSFLPAELQTLMKRVLIEREISKHPADWVFQHPPSDRPELFNRQLNDLVRSIQNSGAFVVLCTHAVGITNPISNEEQQLLIGWRKLYPHVAENAFLQMEQLGNDIIRRVAEATKSDLVDIDANLPKNKEMFADHVHFTTTGATAVAEKIAEAAMKISFKKRLHSSIHKCN